MTASNSKVAREIVLETVPDRVWEALTRTDELRDWFGGELHLWLVPGGDVIFVGDDGERRTGVVEEVDEHRRLVFWWWPENNSSAPGTRVTFELEPLAGGTRLLLNEEEGEPPAVPPRPPIGFSRGVWGAEPTRPAPRRAQRVCEPAVERRAPQSRKRRG